MEEFIIIWEVENKALFDFLFFLSPSLLSETSNRFVSLIGYNYLTFYLMQYCLLYSTFFLFKHEGFCRCSKSFVKHCIGSVIRQEEG